MPVPLVPVLLIGGSALLGGKGVHDTVKAGNKMSAAKRRLKKRRKRYERAEGRHEDEADRFQEKLEALGERRFRALTVLGKAADALGETKPEASGTDEQVALSSKQLEQWKAASVEATEVLGGLAQSAGAGTAVAAGAYGLVGTFGTASTGTAISTLSGAALESATMAGLGGGSLATGGGGMALGSTVLGGLAAGPALFTLGFVAGQKAEKVKTNVAGKMASMDKAEAKMEEQQAVWQAATRRADELQRTTGEAMNALRTLLGESNPGDPQVRRNIAGTAGTLADLLSQTVFED